MTPNTSNPFRPDYAVAPGQTLEETMQAAAMSQTELAQRTGLARKTINGIIHGHEPITPETALLLEKVFRVPASFWNNLQKNYEEAVARLRERDRLAAYAAWPREQGIPVPELVRRGLIAEAKDPIERLGAVLGFFGVATPAEFDAVWQKIQQAYAYRKSERLRAEFGAVAAWLRMGELEAQAIACAEFDRERLKATLPALRALITQPPETFRPEVQRLLADCGVAAVYVAPLRGAPIHGATRWLTPSRAIVQLSLRGQDDGNFWFSLFHELGHVLLHGKTDIFLEVEQLEIVKQQEDEANRFARDLLIPSAYHQEFKQLCSTKKVSKVQIMNFAKMIGITPGIVVGRLQNEKVIPYSYCNDLKIRVGGLL